MNSCDDCVSSALPIGFSFDFYGNTYTDAFVSSNGFSTFNGSGRRRLLCRSALCQPLGGDLWSPDCGPTSFGARVPEVMFDTRRWVVQGTRNSLSVFTTCKYFVTPSHARQHVRGSITARGHQRYRIAIREPRGRPSPHYFPGIENDGGTIGLQIFNGPANGAVQPVLENQGFLHQRQRHGLCGCGSRTWLTLTVGLWTTVACGGVYTAALGGSSETKPV